LRAVILSIGTELVTGLRLDTHSARLARALSAIGAEVVRHETVDDRREDIAAAFRRAAAEADMVVATGGLGPTLDDLTREGLADAMGVPLEENADALAHLESWARSHGRPLSPSNRRQAMLPRGSRALANPVGTAVGVAARIGRVQVYCMPGVPGEMARMLGAEVMPEWRGEAAGRVMALRTVRTFGVPESVVGERLGDLMAADRRPHVGTAVRGGLIDINIYAFGGSDEVATMLEADVRIVRERLGEAVFGEGEATLEQAVAVALAERRATIAVAESCTGGLVAAKLVNVPGISAHLVEAVVAYSDASKVRRLAVPEALLRVHGAVSEPVARAMAEGIRRGSKADLAVADTGTAGPSGGSPAKPVGTVWFALADASGTVAAREIFTGDRALIRERAANYALNLVRLRLLARGRS